MKNWSPESRAKMSALFKGSKRSAEVCAKISANHARNWLGKKMPDDARRKMSEGMKGRVPWNKGVPSTRPVSEAEREKRRQRLVGVRVGSKNPGWKGGITPIRTRLWHSPHYQAWRNGVFAQDDYKCCGCGARSGEGVTVRLEADHFPIPFAAFLQTLIERYGVENLYEAALNDPELWTAKGRTLCRSCHNTTKRGRATLNTSLRAKSDELRAG